MKRHPIALLIALLCFPSLLIASPGGPKPKPPKPHAVVSPKPVKASAPKVKTVSVNAGAGKAHLAKPVKVSKQPPAMKPVKAKPVQATKVTKTSPKGTTSVTPTTSTPTTTTSTGGTVPLTKVQQKLQRNTNLAAKLQGRLPAGADLMTAASGFKNLGQFVAAVNVSNNLDLPFAQLKTLMVDDGYSLGQSIQKMKAGVNPRLEAQRAETDANRLIASTESQPTIATKAKSNKKPSGAHE